ncbi:metallophosphoesterase [Kordia sp. YSTF-M3]|uniref:Metallophosphoesterase n=1 Tax=Kordia aestuariivivens TaxID=2759037 RepID=A0ABR7Q4S0_9FLAO|nr:metallophosphoesterase [Kordia aestuariivivens]MBC8753517.1 metallophosphoesterase [Kordia aestuariivivens]
MKKRIARYVKHITVTILFLALSAIAFGLYHGASLHYGDHPSRMNLDKEGPYVFYENDSTLSVKYLRGNKKDGFYTATKSYALNEAIPGSCYFPLEDTTFDFTIDATLETPQTVYNDGNPILAISDIESGYKTFRDFLMQHQVIDTDLNWTFGKGHLVLVGDFVDRGFSTTQVLWFVYKLEQEAKNHGGLVHFIIGNHELKNMQAKFGAASQKYLGVSAILGKQQHDLYSQESFLGKWLASKNAIEKINGHIFVHGGIHPEVAELGLSLEEINTISRNHYYTAYFPKPQKTTAQLITSTRKGISWYRGYFREDLSQVQIDSQLEIFNAKSVVVGHTLQSKVKSFFNGKIIGIDVKHPKDYNKSWPNSQSEGLLIENDVMFRLLHDGTKTAL